MRRILAAYARWISMWLTAVGTICCHTNSAVSSALPSAVRCPPRCIPRADSRRGGQDMARCNELCTKDATGTCALCEVRTEADEFFRFWFKGGLLLDGVQALKRGRIFSYLRRYAWLMVWWLYPIPRAE